MAWRNPNVRWAKWRAGEVAGDFRGRALIKKNGQLRSEGQMQVIGPSLSCDAEENNQTMMTIKRHVAAETISVH